MKKKLFATLAIFAALALTACGGGTNSGGEESQPAGGSSTQETSSGEASKSTKHTHKYGEWTITKPATCEEKGSQERVCECGEKQTKDIDPLNHDWDEGTVTTPATCSTPGVKTFHCKREGCNATKTEEIVADHTWSEPQAVAGEDGQVAYNVFTCTVCNKFAKIEFAAKQATGKYTINGSLKSDSTYPDFMKLGTNGDSVTYQLQTTYGGTAKIYQRGVMDYWHDGNNENQDRNYYSGKNSSDGNFELTVNGTAVDYSWSKDIKYSDMLPGEYTGTYSPIGDALIGECTIKGANEVNTITYKRTESYNMLIKDFVIVVQFAQ